MSSEDITSGGKESFFLLFLNDVTFDHPVLGSYLVFLLYSVCSLASNK